MFFALLGFYTKPYCMLGGLAIQLYCFIFVNKRDGLIAGIIFFGSLICSYFIVNALFDSYFINTITLNYYLTDKSFKHLLDNMIEFGKSHFSYYLMFLIGVLYFLMEVGKKMHSLPIIDFRNITAPFINKKLPFSIYMFVVTSMIIIGLLGQHIGQDQLYHYQLVSPFVIAAGLCSINYLRESNIKPFVVIGLFSLQLVLYDRYLIPKLERYHNYEKEWEEMSEELSKYSKILNFRSVAGCVVLLNKEVFDNGHSQYAHYLRSFDESPYLQEYVEKVNGFIDEVKSGVVEREFDLIITDNKGWHPFIEKIYIHDNYTFLKEHILSTPSRISKMHFWVPNN